MLATSDHAPYTLTTWYHAPMHAFFHGWRRKWACVTLVMAVALTGMWVRSLIVRDEITFPNPGSRRQLASDAGTLRLGYVTWVSRRKREQTSFSFLISERLSDNDNNEFWTGCDMQWRWSFAGFDFGKGVDDRMLPQQIERWVIPYWSVAIPFTMLSAYLFLGKPRKRVMT
ncbi:MAG: hypothetical protein JWP89_3640 [Schlesneria sp.]|nr:hypothetical protein [Schlesneria sp.]